MKSALYVLFCLTLVQTLFGRESDYDVAQVRVKVEYFVTDADRAFDLMEKAELAAADAKLRSALVAAMKAGDAELMHSGVLNTRAGETATIEAVTETIYPTGYEAGQAPDGTNLTAGEAGEDLGQGLQVRPLPTAYQTRNVGLTLEVEAVLSDKPGEIKLRFAPELTFRFEDDVIAEWQDGMGSADLKMPRFFTLRQNLSLDLLDGVPFLFGVSSPPDEAGKADPQRRVFCFVTAGLRKLGDR